MPQSSAVWRVSSLWRERNWEEPGFEQHQKGGNQWNAVTSSFFMLTPLNRCADNNNSQKHSDCLLHESYDIQAVNKHPLCSEEQRAGFLATWTKHERQDKVWRPIMEHLFPPACCDLAYCFISTCSQSRKMFLAHADTDAQRAEII